MNQSKEKTIKINGELKIPQDMYLNILCPLLNDFCKENGMKFSGCLENIECKETEANKITIL